jgi:hypothetical protein
MGSEYGLMSTTLNVEDILRAVAAHGLTQATTHTWPADPLESTVWSNLLVQVRAQRLEGLFVWAVADGFPVSPEQTAELYDAHAQILSCNLELERLLLEVTGALDAADVCALVLKGPALARTLYPDPTVRLFADIDLLIRSDQYDQACARLASTGYERRYRGPRPGWDRRFTKGTVFQGNDGAELDIHRTLVDGPYGLAIVLADLHADPVRFRIADRELFALGREVSFLHACYNAALADVTPRMVPMRDVAQYLLGSDLDFTKIDCLIRRWRAEAVVSRAISLTASRLGLPDLPSVVQPPPSRARIYDRIAMAAYVGGEDNQPRKQLLSLVGIRGTSAKLAYLRGLVFPQHDYFDGRHRNRWSRWRHAARSIAPHNRS